MSKLIELIVNFFKSLFGMVKDKEDVPKSPQESSSSENEGAEAEVPETPSEGKGKLEEKIIVLDAGHGGKDPGAIGPRHETKEKNINILIAMKIEKILEEQGANVKMIRTDDTFVPLTDRAFNAKSTHADAFVSIHCNSFSDPKVEGMEVYYHEGANDDLAISIGNEMRKITGHKYRGVKRDTLIYDSGFAVLRKSQPVDGALVEVEFISNGIQEDLLLTTSFQERVAKAVADGIVAHVMD